MSVTWVPPRWPRVVAMWLAEQGYAFAWIGGRNQCAEVSDETLRTVVAANDGGGRDVA